jgi:predicted polyphosphate/ATP-dependent NAD kinase
MKIGFLINPLAGIGGAVALKGSDGADIVARALEKGAVQKAGERASQALRMLPADFDCHFVTGPAQMGEVALQRAGIACDVVALDGGSNHALTTAEDTRACIDAFVQYDVDLIVFAGGDGTARDVLDALQSSKATGIPVIGIPAGVKIHSAVYAVTPERAGELVKLILSGEPMSMHDAEVMDLDEDAFRQGKVVARCYGYLRVPVDDTRMQLIKQGGLNHEAVALQDIADDFIENLEQDVYYIIGSGSTTAYIMQQLGLENTLLGVDIIYNGELVAQDADETTILNTVAGKDARIVVTVIGGQGHIFGRGNQQISAQVVRTVGPKNIIIVATNEKLRSLQTRPMIADIDDPDLQQKLAGLREVITGYQQTTLYRLS